MNKKFEIKSQELSGFGLAGWRLPNGKISLHTTDRIIDDWPKEITFHGNTYTLEIVTQGSKIDKNIWENAEYC